MLLNVNLCSRNRSGHRNIGVSLCHQMKGQNKQACLSGMEVCIESEK